MNKTKQLFASLVLTIIGLEAAQASDYQLNLMRGSTWLSRAVYDLHMQILWICVVIGIAVFGVMFYSIFHHRKSKGHKAAQFHHNTKVEIIWGTVPAIIIFIMGWLATGLVREIYNVKDSDMTVLVTGHQFYWDYKYLDSDKDDKNDIAFDSKLDVASKNASDDEEIDPVTVPNYLLNVNEPLVIPIKKKVRFVFTSADVVHSWWVPSLGWKKDANPGFINESWASVENEAWMTGDVDVCEAVPKERWTESDQHLCATAKAWAAIDKRVWSSGKNSVPVDVWNTIKVAGVYRGQCTELCGAGHGFMPVVVVAMKQTDYDKWKDAKLHPKAGATADPLADKAHEELAYEGSLAYKENCAACHGSDGTGGMGPSLKTSSKVTGDIKALAGLVINGKSAMPAFAKKLDAKELASVVTYIRDRLGNIKDDEIQPKAIQDIVTNSDSLSAEASNKEHVTDDVDTNKQLSLNELVSKGETVYANNCQGCHQASGEGMPPVFPALTGSPIVTGAINAQTNLMLKGNNSMPGFGKTLNAVDFAAVLAYTRNKLGNSTGDFKQPSDIQALIAALPAAE